ncbi:MAG: efflux RND transporter periplasmic adaptor subunit [Calditrichaeota bacterium]|nr:efflux RND transporter periplasmic adaptor subunit [Calditrichota bacterium]
MKTILLTLFVFSSLILTSCSEESNAKTIETDKSISEEKVGIPVKISTLTGSQFEEYLNLTGVIKANSQVKIVAEESGILVKLLHEKGSYVKKGAALAIIENKVITANTAQAKASLHEAEINLKSNKVLFSKKAISDNQMKISELNFEKAKASYDLANARSEKLTVSAPISGYVNNRYADVGAYINPASPLFEIVDNSKMKVNIGVAERFIKFIKKGSEIELNFDAFPDLQINSKIDFVAKSIDPENRTFSVESSFANPQGKLAPEMVANIRLLKMKHENSIAIPIDALLDSERGRYVFVEQDNIAIKKNIEILAIESENVLVNGLNPEQRLVVVGHRLLSEGDTLQVIKD